tara:strand:- start:1120 stop:1494 length:375 start_codon:yes stop_codon:yes gene_type:complete
MTVLDKKLPQRIKAGLDTTAKNRGRKLTKKEIDKYVDRKILEAKPKVGGPLEIFFRALSDYQEKNRAHPKWAFLPTQLYERLEDQLDSSATWSRARRGGSGAGLKIGGVEIFWSPHIADVKLGR